MPIQKEKVLGYSAKTMVIEKCTTIIIENVLFKIQPARQNCPHGGRFRLPCIQVRETGRGDGGTPHFRAAK